MKCIWKIPAKVIFGKFIDIVWRNYIFKRVNGNCRIIVK
jgi:hypothetical protein